jgi:beta-lactam-binding protein with PASTA domain
VDAAISILENAGFKVNRFDDFNDTIEKDHVIKQTPLSGDKAKKGSTVTITVSKGSESVTMVDLTGMKEADARAWLETRGLVCVVNKIAKGGIVSGYVWEKDKAVGVKVTQGTTVTLKVQP